MELKALLVQVSKKGDFDNVLNMIKDLINKLQDDLSDISSSASECQDNMLEQQTALKEARMAEEAANNKRGDAQHQHSEASKANKVATEELRQAQHSLKERTSDHVELTHMYNKCITNTEESLAQIQEARDALKQGTETLKTVEDAITGVETGLEEQLKSCKDDKSDEDSEFKQFETDNKSLQDRLEGDIEENTGIMSEQKVVAGEQEEEAKVHFDTGSAAKKELDELKKSCTMGESFDERNAKREAEIKALQEALEVLRAH